jgi:ubiquinone/menaquinone biosynthesis C-methylase UbiE
MLRSQERYALDLADMEAWIRAHAQPGQRILEIGCGDGALVRRLANDFHVLGVDPEGQPSNVVRAQRFEDLDEQPFHVVFASVSLHHLNDPALARSALERLTAPGTIMLVRELDRLTMEHEPTLRWWFEHRKACEHEPDAEESPLPDSFATFVPEWRSMMEHHVRPWPDVRALLRSSGFETVREEPMAYLFRWGLGEDVRAEEERLAAAGTINLVGRRWTGRRSNAE